MKREWAQDVANQLSREGLLTDGITIVLHAGQDYYEELLTLIKDTGVTIRVPTEGLKIGEKISWYNEQI